MRCEEGGRRRRRRLLLPYVDVYGRLRIIIVVVVHHLGQSQSQVVMGPRWCGHFFAPTSQQNEILRGGGEGAGEGTRESGEAGPGGESA